MSADDPNKIEFPEDATMEMDPAIRKEAGQCFAAYSTLGIAPEMSIGEILRHSADTDEELTARDELKKIRSRLSLDLLLYPKRSCN